MIIIIYHIHVRKTVTLLNNVHVSANIITSPDPYIKIEKYNLKVWYVSYMWVEVKYLSPNLHR